MAYKIPLTSFTVTGMKDAQPVAAHLINFLSYTPTEASNPNKGFDIAEIRSRGKVLDKLEEAVEAKADHVMLEDAQYEKLKEVVEKTTFASADRGLLKLIDAVMNAEKV